MATLFQNLNRLQAYERQCLRFIRSNEDRSIVVAIGFAAEQGSPIGFKQLALLHIASASTITRKLKRLATARLIRRAVRQEDGRMVSYVLTRRTLECYKRYGELLRTLNWADEASARKKT